MKRIILKKTLLFLLLLIYSCSQKRAEKHETCDFISNCKSFSEWLKNSNLYWKLDIYNDIDTINCFLKKRNDTVFIISISPPFECLHEFAFFNLNKVDDFFDRRGKCGIVPEGSLYIQSKMLSIEKLNDEKIYSIEQELGDLDHKPIPINSIEYKNLPKLYRHFKISDKRGIIDFKSSKTKGSEDLFWYY